MFNISTAYRKLKKSYLKNLPEFLAFRYKLYPEFVFEPSPKTRKDEIPVFTFHSVEPNRFEEQLRFLAKNRYQTLTADHFYECIIGDKHVPERAIVLTFDDGWGSLWGVAYPLLKKYGFRAVSFLIPGLISEVNSYYPNLDDFWNGRETLEEITSRELSPEPLCTWQEIQKMHESGVIDFQSHTMYHCLIFTSPAIEDFIHPSFDFYLKNYNVPIFRNNGTENISRETELGMPIYTNEPRFSSKKRYFDDEKLRKRCIEYVKDNGGVGFFKKLNWRKKLIDIVEDYRKKYGEAGHFESEEEQGESFYKDLKESKCIIENKLGGKVVSHLCYPWWVGSNLSVEISKKAGYLTNFWGIVEERRTKNRTGDDPYKIGRLLSDEYIFRLPGEGRKPLLKIIKEKFLLNYKGLIKRLLQPDHPIFIEKRKWAIKGKHIFS